MMDVIFQIILIFAAFLTSLVAGLLFIFAVVVMPGIKKLGDREFIKTFQVIDGIIQNNQPLFLIVWIGSFVCLVIAALLSIVVLSGIDRSLLFLAAFIVIFGVQLPTVLINIPLNNRIQACEVDRIDDPTCSQTRQDFEERWNRWNSIRAIFASFATLLLLVLLYSL